MKRFCAFLYFLAMILEAIIRAPYERKRPGIPKAERRVSGAERAILGGLTLLGLVLPLVYAFSRRLDFADYGLSPRARAWAGGLGTGLLGAAVWLFWRGHHDLGRNWSPSLEVMEQHELVTHGVYGTIRHPMYASLLLWGLGQALVLPNWLAGPGGLVTFVAMYLVRVPAEERMMLDHFGESYRAYRERTGGIVPRVGR